MRKVASETITRHLDIIRFEPHSLHKGPKQSSTPIPCHKMATQLPWLPWHREIEHERS